MIVEPASSPPDELKPEDELPLAPDDVDDPASSEPEEAPPSVVPLGAEGLPAELEPDADPAPECSVAPYEPVEPTGPHALAKRRTIRNDPGANDGARFATCHGRT